MPRPRTKVVVRSAVGIAYLPERNSAECAQQCRLLKRWYNAQRYGRGGARGSMGVSTQRGEGAPAAGVREREVG